MPNKREFGFDLLERVRIPELDLYGVVTAITVDLEGVGYKVRYFHNGDSKEVYLYEFEMRRV